MGSLSGTKWISKFVGTAGADRVSSLLTRSWPRPLSWQESTSRLSQSSARRIHSQVYEPDIVIIMDGTLVGKVDVTRGIKKDTIIVANYAGSPKELQDALMTDVECHTLDAQKIAIEEIGKPMVNTVMLGALIKCSPLVGYDHLEDQITSKFTGKLPDKVILKNLSSLKRGYQEVQ